MPSDLLPELTPTSIPEVGYVSPKTVDEAISRWAAFGSKAKVIAGGSDLLHLMKRDSMCPSPK